MLSALFQSYKDVEVDNERLCVMKSCLWLKKNSGSSRINPGTGCAKLTMSLVNVSLKFQTLISEIRQYFLLKKCEKLLQCKSFSHFFSKKYQCIWL